MIRKASRTFPAPGEPKMTTISQALEEEVMVTALEGELTMRTFLAQDVARIMTTLQGQGETGTKSDSRERRDMRAHQKMRTRKTSQRKTLTEIISSRNDNQIVATSNSNKWNQKTWTTTLNLVA